VQISISMRHGHLSQQTQHRISEKVSKLPRIFERLTAASVTVDLEHEDAPHVEIRVSVEHAQDFVATHQAGSVMATVDGSVHKVEQQLRRHKEKLKGHKMTGLKHQEVPLDSEPGEADAASGEY
jgi:putative sigma-54 modulation protein